MDTLSKLMHKYKDQAFLQLRCGKCSANGKLKTGLTVRVPILKSDGTAKVKILGIIKDDPSTKIPRIKPVPVKTSTHGKRIAKKCVVEYGNI